jgi:hypothetical protein
VLAVEAPHLNVVSSKFLKGHLFSCWFCLLTDYPRYLGYLGILNLNQIDRFIAAERSGWPFVIIDFIFRLRPPVIVNHLTAGQSEFMLALQHLPDLALRFPFFTRSV